VLLPAAVFRELGVEPPLAAAGSGFHDFIPTQVGRADALRIVAASFWAYCGPRRDEALERMRRVVLQYAMVPTHRASFRGSFPALDEATAAWQRGDRRAALRLVGDDTVHALCAVGAPSRAADYARALRAAGVALPIVLTPGAAPGDADGARATITGLAAALDLPPR
jgi:alkanesulfonate monooxygenase SsuD/methylene tetrahydromethanopterin reductase-like flavin-dependent oxidoreductase (luciferase family)